MLLNIVGVRNRDNDFFGNQKRMREYRMLFYAGVLLLIAGLFLFIFFTNYLSAYGIAFLFIGFMCLVAGFLGLREEFKKYGTERVETRYGKGALAVGVIGLSSIHFPPLSLVCAIGAIVLGKKALKRGDNTYGRDGMICGIVALLMACYIVVLDIFFI